MESNIRNELKVGLFAIAGLVLFCLSIIMLGGSKSLFSSRYELKIRLPQVQGLGKGSVVTLTGVQVGNVSAINFIAGSSDVEVTVEIDSKVQDRITEGSKASIKTQGALGDKYVFIEPGPTGATPLKEGAIIETDKTPDLIDMIASKGAELGEIIAVIKEVRQMFENINRDGKSAKLMANLVEGSDNFNKFMAEARATFKDFRSDAIGPMSSVMRKLDSGQGTLGALISDPTVYNKISGFLGESPRNKFLKPLIRESIETSEGKKKSK